jgi:hypothetical protein
MLLKIQKPLSLKQVKKLPDPFSSLWPLLLWHFFHYLRCRVLKDVFSDLAITYGIALGAALFLSLTYAPAFTAWLFKTSSEKKDTLLVRWLNRAYAPVLQRCVDWPKAYINCGCHYFGSNTINNPFHWRGVHAKS